MLGSSGLVGWGGGGGLEFAYRYDLFVITSVMRTETDYKIIMKKCSQKERFVCLHVM